MVAENERPPAGPPAHPAQSRRRQHHLCCAVQQSSFLFPLRQRRFPLSSLPMPGGDCRRRRRQFPLLPSLPDGRQQRAGGRGPEGFGFRLASINETASGLPTGDQQVFTARRTADSPPCNAPPTSRTAVVPLSRWFLLDSLGCLQLSLYSAPTTGMRILHAMHGMLYATIFLQKLLQRRWYVGCDYQQNLATLRL